MHVEGLFLATILTHWFPQALFLVTGVVELSTAVFGVCLLWGEVLELLEDGLLLLWSGGFEFLLKLKVLEFAGEF